MRLTAARDAQELLISNNSGEKMGHSPFAAFALMLLQPGPIATVVALNQVAPFSYSTWTSETEILPSGAQNDAPEPAQHQIAFAPAATPAVLAAEPAPLGLNLSSLTHVTQPPADQVVSGPHVAEQAGPDESPATFAIHCMSDASDRCASRPTGASVDGQVGHDHQGGADCQAPPLHARESRAVACDLAIRQPSCPMTQRLIGSQ